MDNEAGQGSTGGGGQAGAAPAGGQPAGGSQAPTGGGGIGGGIVTHGAPAGLPPDILPEQLRNLPVNQIKYLLQNMVQATQNTAQENKQLKQRLAELERKGRSGPASKGKQNQRQEAPGEDDLEDKPLEELILDNPELAIARVIESRYGGDLNRLREGYGESMFHALRSEIPDFREHEDEIREILNESGAQFTKENIQGAYLMSLGKKQLEERRQRLQQQESIETGSGTGGDKGDQKPKRELTPLQKEIATGMGLTYEEYIEQQEKWESGSFDVRVPDGKPRGG